MASDLVQVGWAPEGEPRFVYGFCNIDKSPDEVRAIAEQWTHLHPDYDPTRTHTAHPGVMVVGTSARYSDAGMAWLGDEHPCDVLARMRLLHAFRVEPHGFKAFAIGNLDEDPDLEVWSIDDRKNLEQLALD